MPDAGMLDAGAGCRMPGMSKTLLVRCTKNCPYKSVDPLQVKNLIKFTSSSSSPITSSSSSFSLRETSGMISSSSPLSLSCMAFCICASIMSTLLRLIGGKWFLTRYIRALFAMDGAIGCGGGISGGLLSTFKQN